MTPGKAYKVYIDGSLSAYGDQIPIWSIDPSTATLVIRRELVTILSDGESVLVLERSVSREIVGDWAPPARLNHSAKILTASGAIGWISVGVERGVVLESTNTEDSGR